MTCVGFSVFNSIVDNLVNKLERILLVTLCKDMLLILS